MIDTTILKPTGIKEIDRQHYELLESLDRLKGYVGTRHEFAASMEAIDALYDYTFRHLSYEESFLQAISYPDLEAHRAKHRVLTGNMDRLLREVTAGGEITTALQQTITDWIVDHINGEDPIYVAYLASLSDEK